MRRYARVVRPDITVVTSIGSEHRRSLRTLDVTRDEKAWMVRALGPGGTAVLNGDDANVMWMASQTRARIVTYGFGEACEVRAVDVQLHRPRGMRFRLVAFGTERAVALRLVGRHMVYPALAALAVAQVEGMPLDEAIARVSALEPTPGQDATGGVAQRRDPHPRRLSELADRDGRGRPGGLRRGPGATPHRQCSATSPSRRPSCSTSAYRAHRQRMVGRVVDRTAVAGRHARRLRGGRPARRPARTDASP